MLKKKRTAIIFTANTPHLAKANLMIESLKDEDRGNFKGDLWVISTGLSARAKNYLDSINASYLVNQLSELKEWKYWEKIAEAQPEYEEKLEILGREESLRIAFESYRNKRMSKLIILDWIKKFGNDYDFIALCDNDLLFQRNIHELFEKYYHENEDKLYYWQEENEMVAQTSLWRKNYHYSYRHDASELNFGKHEINIGFILGKPSVIFKIFSDVKRSFFDLNLELFTRHSWHDQDLVRLNRAKYPERFQLLEEGEVVHICNGGMKVVEEKYPNAFYHLKTGEKPYVIHFAGGTWERYFSIKSTYMVEPDDYYYSQELKKEYDVVREKTFIHPFDKVSAEYYTEQNQKTKIDSRREWISLSNNGKKKLLFIGWLQVGTHKSTLQALPRFFEHDTYDIAILNGNVAGMAQRNLCEEFPIIIAQLTRIVRDPYLVRVYGYRLPDISDELYADINKAVMCEYGCSERAAIAVANLVYLYFEEAISFYLPDLVCIWNILGPSGKMIKKICERLSIPCCSMEWGILPGTVAFDFCGHMGESWVATESEFFNGLPISEVELEKANDYLRVATDPELSRNVAQSVEVQVLKKIESLRKSGKKIILFMGCNGAHSGNTLADIERAHIHSPFFEDDNEAYRALLNVCKQHEDWHILYKPHPTVITRGNPIDIDENCTTMLYKGGLSETLALVDVSVTILSQGAYVSLINNVPTLLLGRIQLNNSGAAYVLENDSDLETILGNALVNGYTNVHKKCFLEHVARVLKYYVFSGNPKVEARDSYQLGETIIDIITGSQQDFYRYEREAYCSQLLEKKDKEEIPLVSVIMPIYNGEEYLASSINSICRQFLKDIELICVNNGSTDGTQQILEYLKTKDSRIKIIRQEEPNQSRARNVGIDSARGKYLYFMDCDDYLDREALKMLVDVADEKNADLVYFFFKEVNSEPISTFSRPRWYSYTRFLPKERVYKLEKEHYKFFIQYPFTWAKLLKRDFVQKEKLYFEENCRNYEDNPHNLKALFSSSNVYVCSEQFYNYRRSNESLSQKKSLRALGMLDAVRLMNNIYIQYNCYEEYAKWYVPYKIHLLAWAWDLVPHELQENYYKEVSELFLPGDISHFQDDFVWSYYEMPSQTYRDRIQKMLSCKDEHFNV